MTGARLPVYVCREPGFHRLSPRQRQVVDLRCRCGLTNDETARALGIGVPTVKRHAWEVGLRTGYGNIARTCYEYRAWHDQHGEQT